MNTAVLTLALSLALPPDVHPDDLDRFPGLDTINAVVAAIEQHQVWLSREMELHVWDKEDWYWRPADMYRRWDVWTDLRTARQMPSAEGRKCWLRKVRDKIGFLRYEFGLMPPPVPVECFARID